MKPIPMLALAGRAAVRTLGVDLAAATRKTAAAVVEWGNGTARLAHLALDVGDEEIVRLFGAGDMTGIDCPVGWPDAFLPFLAGHLAFEPRPRAGPMTASKDAGCWPTGTPTASSPPGPG